MGIDASPQQVSIAKRKDQRGAASFYVQDMQRIHLEGRYDAAICLFGGFGYVLADEDVGATLESLYRHLSAGGVFIFEFWNIAGVNPAAFTDAGYRSWDIAKADKDLILRLSRSQFDPRTNVLSTCFKLYVLRGNRLIDRFGETHRLRAYSTPEVHHHLRYHRSRLVATYATARKGDELQQPAPNDFRIIAVARRT